MKTKKKSKDYIKKFKEYKGEIKNYNEIEQSGALEEI